MAVTPMRLDHVAYRCVDAAETARFYAELLDMKLVAAVTDQDVPSTKETCPHIHIFLAMKDGSCVAFFECPDEAPMGRDPNTPAWVQHLALEVEDRAAMDEVKARLEARGIKVIGPKDGYLCVSIYFFDPSGHRLEISTRKVVPDGRTERDAYRILERWSATKKPVRGLELEHPLQ
jgi:glyoxylase I family protein